MGNASIQPFQSQLGKGIKDWRDRTQTVDNSTSGEVVTWGGGVKGDFYILLCVCYDSYIVFHQERYT